MLATPTLLLIAGGFGVATHVFYFHGRERHLHPQRYLQVCVIFFLLSTAGSKHVRDTATLAFAMQETGKILGSYIAGIYLSLVIFRLFLNPLNKFPGRPLARLSALDHSFRIGKDRDMYLKLYQSHKKLGMFVRTGPHDLSVTHPDVVRVALSAQAVCEKAPWYEVEAPAYSLQSTRVRSQHDKRRRIWSPAFSDKALRGYEMRVHRYNECLMLHIDSFSRKCTVCTFEKLRQCVC
jgi:tryprostatin B 6-hydroxylase